MPSDEGKPVDGHFKKEPRYSLFGPVGWGLIALAFCTLVILLGMPGAGGRWIYPLDDAYIHLALARNLASTGVWGIQPGEFAFCSSSPLWTLLLAACFKLLPFCEWLPGLLSVGFTAAAIASLANLLQPLERWKRLLCLGLVLLALPAAVTGTLGMEHALHAWLTILLIKAFMRYRGAEKPARATGVGLAIVGLLATATRMESLFLIIPMAVLLAGEKRWRLSIGGNHVCLSPHVMLYATSPNAAGALRVRLAELRKSLPPQTSIDIFSPEGESS